MTDKPDMRVEVRQVKLQANSEAIDRWNKKLFRAANELQKLNKERKRLLGPPRNTVIKYRNLADIPRMAGGGSDFHSDDIPL